jgi:uncharacterized protein (DUF1684 family)
MKSRNIIFVFVVIGISILVYYTFQGDQTAKAYADEILKERKDKDGFMRSADGSPFGVQKASFTGLKYFPPDMKYRIQADLRPTEKKEMITLTTNDGKTQSYLSYAYAEFDFENLHNRLLILEVLDEGPDRGKLFLAFADQTSANETYGAGRYLDIKKVPGASTITLDFNSAYNPYCAYTESFSCPFPPQQNVLKIPIRAGELTYK